MADVLHASITDPYLHEPKGAAAASANTVYHADGAGSGTWALPQVLEFFCVSGVIADVSSPGSIYLPIPTACTIVGATMVLGAGITGADSLVTFFNSSAASLGDAVTITQSGSAAGSTFSFTAELNTSLSAGTYVRVTTDGGSTTTAPLYVTLLLSKTVTRNG